MWKHIRRVVTAAGFVGGAIAALSTQSIPETIKAADGYLGTNLKWFGWENPPDALASAAADHTFLLIGLTLLALGGLAALSWLIEWSWKRWRRSPQSLPGRTTPLIDTDPSPAQPQSEFHAALDRYTDMNWSVQDEIDLQRRKREERECGGSEEWEWLSAREEGRNRAKRDKPLSEALAYNVEGRWGCEFFDAMKAGLDPGGAPLKRAVQLAYDGALLVWGKRTESGVYEAIPKEYWADHHVDDFSLMRAAAKTVPNSRAASGPLYFDLMVSRSQFEEVLPYVK